jgi:hypothetical protein
MGHPLQGVEGWPRLLQRNALHRAALAIYNVKSLFRVYYGLSNREHQHV